MSAQQRAVLYIVVVFFTGVVAGALVMNVVEHVWMHPALAYRAPASSSWDKDREHYMEEFRRELHLTDAQSKQLEEILDETMRQYDDLHSFSHHIREDGLTRIRAILNDDQRKTFDQLTAKMAQERAERRRRATPQGTKPGAEPAQPSDRGTQPADTQPAPQTTPQP